MAFAAMIAALFADPVLAKSAVYLPRGASETQTVRVIAKQPDTITSFGEVRFHNTTTLFDIQAAEVATPEVGDQLTVDGAAYAVQSEPTADRERLVWTLDVVLL